MEQRKNSHNVDINVEKENTRKHMSSAAALNYLSSASRRFLSNAYHHRAAPTPVNTLVEPQRTYSITILPDRLRLPEGTTFVQLALFDITFREPLGLPLRFKVNEAGEIAAEAFGEHSIRALQADRIYLIVEAVLGNEEPSPDRPFREEALAFGWFPLGMRTNSERKTTSDIALFRGSALGHLCSASFRPGTDPQAQTLGNIFISMANVAKAAPSDMIFPPYRFVPARVVSADVVAGRTPLHVMKVSVDSFSLRFGDGRGGGGNQQGGGNSSTAAAVIAGSSWSLVAMTHSGYKPLSNAVAANLTQHPAAQDVLRTSSSFVVDNDTPIHETSHLVIVLRRETPAGHVGIAVGVLPLCPKVDSVRDAVVRVTLLPMLTGPFVPSYDANPGHCVARPVAASAMFQRSDWSCALMVRIENTPVPAPRPTSLTAKRRKPSSVPQMPDALDDSGVPACGGGQGPRPLRARPANEMMLPANELMPEQQKKHPQQPRGGGKKGGRVPVPQVHNFADEPPLMPTSPEEGGHHGSRRQHQQQMMMTMMNGGAGGMSSAASDAQLREMQSTIETLRKEMFSMLSDITRDLHGVTKEVNYMYRTGAGAHALVKKGFSAAAGDRIAVMSQDGEVVMVPAGHAAGGAGAGDGGNKRPAFRVADAPLCRAQAALSSALRARLLDRQHPMRHPDTQEPLAHESVLCSKSLPDTRFCIRINGITLNNALMDTLTSNLRTQRAAGEGNDGDDPDVAALPEEKQRKQRQPPRKFSFRIYCGVAVQRHDDPAGSAACEAPLPAMTGVVTATSDAGEVLYATRLDAQDATAFAAHRAAGPSGDGPSLSSSSARLAAEEMAAREGYWLEPSAPDSDVHLRGTIPAYIRKMRSQRASINYSTTPACVTIEILDGYSRFPIGYATLPIDAFQRPHTTTHTIREEDLVVRSEASFCRDSTHIADAYGAAPGSSAATVDQQRLQATCPAFKPFIGTLHLTACAIGYAAPSATSDIPSAAGTPRNVLSAPAENAGSHSARGLGVVEVPRLGATLAVAPSTSSASAAVARRPTPPTMLNNNSNNNSGMLNTSGALDGSGFLASARLTHLHSKRVEVLKATMVASSSPRSSVAAPVTFGGNGGADRDVITYQAKVMERQRDERKHSLIQDALQRRMQLDASVVCPAGRPAIADFAFRNPYPATMAFTLEFVKSSLDPSAQVVACEAAAGFGHSFICAPLEEKTVQICVRARGILRSGTAKTSGGPECQCKVRVLDDKGECVKVLNTTAIVLPPHVDRVLRVYGGPGTLVKKDIFVRCFDQHLVVAAEKSDVGLSRMQSIIKQLCCRVGCTGEDARSLVRDASTSANIQYLFDGAVATWEELSLCVAVPNAPTTVFLHLYGDESMQNCLMTWAVKINPVQVIDTQPILCGQTNTFTIPLPNFRSVYCTNATDLAVSASIVPVNVAAYGGAQPAGTLVQLHARPLKPQVYSVLIHAAESDAAAQAGRIHVVECRVPAQLMAATFARTMHVAPRATPLFLRVLVRNEDTQRQRVFRVSHNMEAFVSVKPKLFMLGPNDQMPVSVSVALAALSVGHGTQAAKYPLRLTVNDNDDKISDVFQIDLIVDPSAVSIENMDA